jgi:hypothetical protein
MRAYIVSDLEGCKIYLKIYSFHILMENINIELNEKEKEQEKKQKYHDYQREYHSNYCLQQRLEDDLIEKKTNEKVKETNW